MIAALAENASFIKSIFLTQDINDYGIYGVYLCKDGKYTQYIIDDFFPCDNKLSIECFSHGVKILYGYKFWKNAMQKHMVHMQI